MRLKFFLTMALLGLLGAQFSMAQEGLGKKSGSPQSGKSGSQSRSTSGRTSSGVKSDPGPRGGSSVRSTPPTQQRGSGSASSRGQSGNPGLGKRESGPAVGAGPSRGQSSGSGSVLGRPDRTNSGGSLGKGQSSGSGSVLGRPDRTSSGGSLGKGQSSGSGSVLGRPDRTSSGGSLGKGQSSGSGSVLGRPDRTSSGGNLGKGQSSGSGSVLGRPDRGSFGQSGGSLGKGQDGGTVLGRPNRGDSGQLNGGDVFGKRGNGSANSGSHNGFGSVKPSTVRSIPKVGPNNRIVREVNRENRVHANDNRYRNGYWAYNRGWCDDDFSFGRYGFTWYDGCHYVPSPFYWYYHLPPYLDYTCVRIGPITWISCNTRYQWYAPAYDNLGYNDRNRGNQLEYAVDNIRLAFDRQSMRYIYDMVPSGGRVEIETDNDEGYSVEGDDFANMLRDLVETTSTIDYRIVDVYRDGDRATVVADHRYRDSWGDERCVRHTYGLRSRRGGYEIGYFRSVER